MPHPHHSRFSQASSSPNLPHQPGNPPSASPTKHAFPVLPSSRSHVFASLPRASHGHRPSVDSASFMVAVAQGSSAPEGNFRHPRSASSPAFGSSPIFGGEEEDHDVDERVRRRPAVKGSRLSFFEEAPQAQRVAEDAVDSNSFGESSGSGVSIVRASSSSTAPTCRLRHHHQQNTPPARTSNDSPISPSTSSSSSLASVPDADPSAPRPFGLSTFGLIPSSNAAARCALLPAIELTTSSFGSFAVSSCSSCSSASSYATNPRARCPPSSASKSLVHGATVSTPLAIADPYCRAARSRSSSTSSLASTSSTSSSFFSPGPNHQAFPNIDGDNGRDDDDDDEGDERDLDDVTASYYE
jgi:hypothetical protein